METATKPKVECDDKHIYRVDGVVKPGFTEMCKAIGFPDNPHWTEAGREEGTALSKWVLFLAKGNKASELPDERISGRVWGIRKFLTEHDLFFSGGETPLYNPALGYCVTPDLWGTLDGKPAVIEAKRGAKMKRHGLQTSAQALALAENGFHAERRFCLYLKNGDYALDEHDDQEDFECWRAIVAGYFAVEAYK